MSAGRPLPRRTCAAGLAALVAGGCLDPRAYADDAEALDAALAAAGWQVLRVGSKPPTRFRREPSGAIAVAADGGAAFLVLQHYPVESIRDIDSGLISGGLISGGPWARKRLAIEGQAVSLDDIEHRILRPIWRDPRIHYAVNCASLGCPNLAAEAFTAANTERMLDDAARAYVDHPRGVALDGGRATASSLYQWFRADFGGSEPAVLDHLRRYASPPLAARLADLRTIDRYRYDWSLNDSR